jgi:hypothetical protein
MRSLLVLSVVPALGLSIVASAQIQSTTTSLSLSGVSSISPGTVETLTVQVTSSSNAPVARGIVRFYDGQKLLAMRSIIETGASNVGSAVFKTLLPSGVHSLRAEYAGLANSYVRSTSATQMVTVTGGNTGQVTLSATSAWPYTLTTQITRSAGHRPAGTVSFLDQTNQSTIGSADVSPSTGAASFRKVNPYTITGPAVDVNNDGILDLTSQPYVFLGKGDGTFPAANEPSGNFGGDVTDFNRDGIPDFLKLASGQPSAYLGDGAGAFTLATGAAPESFSTPPSVAGDFNNDGIPDLLYLTISGSRLYLGDAQGHLTYSSAPPILFLGDTEGQAPLARDVNGDGNLDVITPFHNANAVAVAIGNGDGTFSSATFPAGIAPSYVVVDDMNGDGFLDLIAVQGGGVQTHAVSILLGNGDGTFQAPRVTPQFAFVSPGGIGTGDINGDGIPDVITTGSYQMLVLLGYGDGTLGAPIPTFNTFNPYAPNLPFEVKDLNNDGLADVVAFGDAYLSSSGVAGNATLPNAIVQGAGYHSVVALFTPSDGSAPVQSNPVYLLAADSSVDASAGFTAALGLHQNGSATINGTALQLTDGGVNQVSSSWSSTPVKATSFTSDFHFRITNPQAEGFTFALQNAGPSAIGAAGGELGFNPIQNGVALKFDINNNAGEGADTVGLYASGSSLTGAGMALPSNVSLLSGHTMLAHVTYDGFTLNLVLTDTTTGASATYRKVFDIPGIIGSNTAYAGFTAATGAQSSSIQILDWTYAPGTVSMDSVARFSNLGLSLNGTAKIQNGTVLNLTQNASTDPNAKYKAASAWSVSPFDITSFHSTFTFVNQYTTDGPPADGFTFTLQRSSPSAIGSFGGELGFNFIPNSVALKFDFFNNNGEGANTVGLYPAGVSMTDASLSVPVTGLDIRDAVYTKADVTYDGTTLSLVLTNPNSGATFTWSKVTNLPALIGGNTAFVGFTAGTGELTTAVFIESWRHVTGSTQ